MNLNKREKFHINLSRCPSNFTIKIAVLKWTSPYVTFDVVWYLDAAAPPLLLQHRLHLSGSLVFFLSVWQSQPVFLISPGGGGGGGGSFEMENF